MSRLVVAAGVGGIAVALACACGAFDDASPPDAGTTPDGSPAGDATANDASTDAGASNEGGEKRDAGKLAVTTVTKGVNAPWYLAFAGSDLVVGRKDDQGGVFKVPKTGGEPVKIGSRPAFGVAVSGSTVYYCDNRPSVGALMRVQLDGGGETPLNSGECLEIAIQGSEVFFTGGDRDAIERLSTGDGGVLALYSSANDVYPEGIAADPNAIYVAALHQAAIVKIPTGENPTVFQGPVSEPRRLVLDGDDIYWIEHNSKGVHRMKKDGSNPISIGSSPDNNEKGGIAVDATHVYWVMGRNPGALYRVHKVTGGAPEVVVDDLNLPVDVIVDTDYAYVSVAGENRIIRVSKN